MDRPALFVDSTNGARYSNIRTIVVDARGLLVDLSLWRRQLVRVLRQAGLAIGYEQFCHAWDSQFAEAVYRGRRDQSEAVVAWLRSHGLGWSQIDEIEAACRSCADELSACERPLPGIAKALARIAAAGYRLAAFSNSAARGVEWRARFREIGLSTHWDWIATSCDVDAVLPDGAAIDAVLFESRRSPKDALFISRDRASCLSAWAGGVESFCAVGQSGQLNLTDSGRLTDLIDALERSRRAPAGY